MMTINEQYQRQYGNIYPKLHQQYLNSNDHQSSLLNDVRDYSSQRNIFKRVTISSLGILLSSGITIPSIISKNKPTFDNTANAVVNEPSPVTITDRIYIDIKGLPSSNNDNNENETGTSSISKRIVIGLYGKDAPSSVQKIKQFVTKGQGLSAVCKPKQERTLQKEQLEANKVYSTCIDSQSIGVPIQDSTIWRIISNERIDIGAVKGKFVAREYPNWLEEDEVSKTDNNTPYQQLRHNKPGVVSVRRGNTSGFGFTIYPGSSTADNNQQLDDDHIIIGQVIDGYDIIEQLNTNIPVIQSSKLNYMSFTGGTTTTTTTTSPNRSCQYGGPMYCNEFKPLIKLTIINAGIL